MLDNEQNSDTIDVQPAFDAVEQMSFENVRVVTFVNGLSVITIFVDQGDGTIVAILPMELTLDIHEEDLSIKAYSLDPYQENLYPFDVMSPTPVIFSESAVMSVGFPTEHLFRNYYCHLKYRKSLLVDEPEETPSIH